MIFGVRSIIVACALVSLASLATACTAAPAPVPAANGRTGTGVAASGHPRTMATQPAPKPRAAPKPRPAPKPAAPHVIISRVRMADGVVVTVAAFRGPVRYVLHNGASDPGYAAARTGVTAGPAIGNAEHRQLLAAFNGGFKLGVGAGGYEQEGHVISPLLKGDASLIIDRSGRARIALWGYSAPGPGEAVYSVRQNLQLLVEHGKPTPAASDWYAWGATLGGGEYVARSAVGEDAAGGLLSPGACRPPLRT